MKVWQLTYSLTNCDVNVSLSVNATAMNVWRYESLIVILMLVSVLTLQQWTYDLTHSPASSACTTTSTLCCISHWHWSNGAIDSWTASSTDCSSTASLSHNASFTHWRRHSKCALSFVLACAALVSTWTQRKPCTQLRFRLRCTRQIVHSPGHWVAPTITCARVPFWCGVYKLTVGAVLD